MTLHSAENNMNSIVAKIIIKFSPSEADTASYLSTHPQTVLFLGGRRP